MWPTLHSQHLPHMPKCAKSSIKWVQGHFYKTKNFAGIDFKIFFYQGPKPKFAIFAGTKSIF
jgi:hypothetical protein